MTITNRHLVFRHVATEWLQDALARIHVGSLTEVATFKVPLCYLFLIVGDLRRLLLSLHEHIFDHPRQAIVFLWAVTVSSNSRSLIGARSNFDQRLILLQFCLVGEILQDTHALLLHTCLHLQDTAIGCQSERFLLGLEHAYASEVGARLTTGGNKILAFLRDRHAITVVVVLFEALRIY